MNDMKSIEPLVIEMSERTIDTVTVEIVEICRQARTMALSYAIEVGRRLCEAKEFLKHGEWGDWLKDQVNFSQSTANNLMRLFKEYGAGRMTLLGVISNSQALGNLPYTKALQLLALSSEDRENFVQEHKVDEMTTRELEKLIKERDEALRKKEDLEERYDDLHKLSQELAGRVEEGKVTRAELEKANEKLAKQAKSLENVKALEKQIADQKKQIAERDKTISERLKELEAAKRASSEPEPQIVQQYEDEIARLKKQALMSDADITEFRVLFDTVQGEIEKLLSIISRVANEDEEKANRFRSALAMLAGMMRGDAS